MNILIYDDCVGYLALSKCLILCDIKYNLIHLESGNSITKKLYNLEFEFAFVYLSYNDFYALKIIESKLINKNIIIISDIPLSIYYNHIEKNNIIGYIDRSEIAFENIKDLCNSYKNKEVYLSNKSKKSLLTLNSISSNNKHKLEDYINKLSLQEYSIFKQITIGLTSTEISNKLNLHKSSVSTYKKRILEKFSVKSYHELTILLSILKYQ